MSKHIMNKLLSIVAILPLALCMSTISFALESDRSAPIELEADTVSLDSQKEQATYTGNVRLIQGSILIEANSIVIHTKNKKVERAIIQGTDSLATFEQEVEPGKSIIGQANKIILVQGKDEISFHDNALIMDGENKIKGQFIKYNSKEHKIIANGGTTDEPVRMIFQPTDITETKELN